MTNIEKSIIRDALKEYAANHKDKTLDACTAASLVYVFDELLKIPCGEARI